MSRWMVSQSRVSRSTCNVPTMRTPISRANTVQTAGFTAALCANMPLSDILAARFSSSLRNSQAMIRPMPMPKMMERMMRAMATSMPMAAPV